MSTNKNKERVLFIPKKLRIGFKKRPNSADGLLSYVIYFDEKNKIRKETSFLGWIDKTIPTMDLENNEISGFRILTSIKRNPYHFGDATEKVRIYDPRGFEFEISMSNLIFLFDHGNLIDLEYKSKCVYSWNKGELILLPVNSLAYKTNVDKLALINNKLKEKDMIIGASYSLKKSNEELIYLGKYFYLKSYNYSKNTNKLIKSLDLLNTKSAISIKQYTELNKEKYIFLKVENNNAEIVSYTSLTAIEEVKNEMAMSLEEVDKITKTNSFKNTPFEFTENKNFKSVYFFENEKYEFILSSAGHFSTNYNVVIIDKAKNTIIKNNTLSEELEIYVKRLIEKTKMTKEHLNAKYLKISGKELFITL